MQQRALLNVAIKKRYMSTDSFEKKLNGEWINIEDPFARRLIESYLGRRVKEIEELRLYIENDEFDAIRRKGHNLYGSGSAYGLDWISAIGKSIVDAADHGDKSAVVASINALESYIDARSIG